jgi:Uma2 family endonuclease
MKAIHQEQPVKEAYIPPYHPEQYVSEEDYWNYYYSLPDVSYEWNNGVLEEKPMADYLSTQMYLWFLQLLQDYLKTYPIAKLLVLDFGFRLALPHKTTIRKPDLAVIHESNPVGVNPFDRSFRGIYDLCIEFLSDSTKKEVERDTVVKKSEYGQIGVTEYFILDRKGDQTAFYRLSRRGTYAAIAPRSGGVIQSAALPGFQFRIDHLYDRPPLIDIVHDPVYTGFVLKEYQEQYIEAKAARQRAEAERQRADAAVAAAEKLAEKLRSLGVDPNICG